MTRLYCICRNPSDYPGKFVVREHQVRNGGRHVVAFEPLAVTSSLELAREALPPGLYNLGRCSNDDPVIVEVWV